MTVEFARARDANPGAPPPHRDGPIGAGNTWWRGAIVGAAALALAAGALATIRLLARPLALLLGAAASVQALAPAVDWPERRLPRALVIGLVYLGVLLVLGGIGWPVVPPLAEQARSLATNAPGLVEGARRWFDRWDQLDAEAILAPAQSEVGQLGAILVALPLTIVSSVTEMILVLTLSAYWLLAQPALRRFPLSLFPCVGYRGHPQVVPGTHGEKC